MTVHVFEGRAPLVARVLVPVVAITLGTIALATRPLAWGDAGTLVLVGMLGLVGVVPTSLAPAGRARWLGVVALGAAAFALVRLVEVPIARPFTAAAVAACALAAVAEEAFFRRYIYGWLARWGTPIAIGGAALLFALVHVPRYGVDVLPLDLAAGVLFGWQRWATGGWTAPAATHAIANLLQMG